ncbi:unnamed protein product [Gadus morhua 'NCC']
MLATKGSTECLAFSAERQETQACACATGRAPITPAGSQGRSQGAGANPIYIGDFLLGPINVRRAAVRSEARNSRCLYAVTGLEAGPPEPGTFTLRSRNDATGRWAPGGPGHRGDRIQSTSQVWSGPWGRASARFGYAKCGGGGVYCWERTALWLQSPQCGTHTRAQSGENTLEPRV